MNKHAHTPGPWDWKDGFSVVVGTSGDPEGNPIANIVGNPSEQFVNARLIAAAPDLLNALELLIADHDYLRRQSKQSAAGPCPIQTQARAAIAKAKGEG